MAAPIGPQGSVHEVSDSSSSSESERNLRLEIKNGHLLINGIAYRAHFKKGAEVNLDDPAQRNRALEFAKEVLKKNKANLPLADGLKTITLKRRSLEFKKTDGTVLPAVAQTAKGEEKYAELSNFVFNTPPRETSDTSDTSSEASSSHESEEPIPLEVDLESSSDTTESSTSTSTTTSSDQSSTTATESESSSSSEDTSFSEPSSESSSEDKNIKKKFSANDTQAAMRYFDKPRPAPLLTTVKNETANTVKKGDS